MFQFVLRPLVHIYLSISESSSLDKEEIKRVLEYFPYDYKVTNNRKKYPPPFILSNLTHLTRLPSFLDVLLCP